jgi:hypothetical protein
MEGLIPRLPWPSQEVRDSEDQAFGQTELNGRVDRLTKDVRVKRMPGSLIAFQLCNRPAELSCYGLQRRKFRRLALRPKAIQDAAQDSVLGTFMDVGIEAVEVAQAGLKPMRSLFEDKEAMRSLSPDAVGKAQLEGHVEAGNPQRARHRNPAEVVDRRTATRDQAINPVQTILASGRDL